MIGSALKKLAAENGMKVAKGVAYGVFRGYYATFSEGSGYKQIVFATRFSEQSKQDELMGLLSRHNLSKEYRVQNLSFAPNGINIVFGDTIGTMKKIMAFLDWFFPLLEQYGASRAGICPECGAPIDAGTWILQDGVAAFISILPVLTGSPGSWKPSRKKRNSPATVLTLPVFWVLCWVPSWAPSSGR